MEMEPDDEAMYQKLKNTFTTAPSRAPIFRDLSYKEFGRAHCAH